MEQIQTLNEALKKAIEKGDQYNIGYITSHLIKAIDDYLRENNR
jgi:vacuolar-type H+-ATPase subunit F/Vma7